LLVHVLQGERETEVPEGLRPSEHRRAQFKALADDTLAPGLIAYRDDVPVGWVALAATALRQVGKITRHEAR
jgi:hypothetical protein